MPTESSSTSGQSVGLEEGEIVDSSDEEVSHEHEQRERSSRRSSRSEHSSTQGGLTRAAHPERMAATQGATHDRRYSNGARPLDEGTDARPSPAFQGERCFSHTRSQACNSSVDGHHAPSRAHDDTQTSSDPSKHGLNSTQPSRGGATGAPPAQPSSSGSQRTPANKEQARGTKRRMEGSCSAHTGKKRPANGVIERGAHASAKPPSPPQPKDALPPPPAHPEPPLPVAPPPRMIAALGTPTAVPSQPTTPPPPSRNGPHPRRAACTVPPPLPSWPAYQAPPPRPPLAHLRPTPAHPSDTLWQMPNGRTLPPPPAPRVMGSAAQRQPPGPAEAPRRRAPILHKVAGISVSVKSGQPSRLNAEKRYTLSVGVAGGAAEADRVGKLTRLDRKRMAKAEFRQRALSIIRPFYEEAQRKLAEGKTLQDLSEKERVSLTVIADDEKVQKAEALAREDLPYSSRPYQERQLLAWRTNKQKELFQRVRAAKQMPCRKELNAEVAAKNKMLQAVLLKPAAQHPERFSLDWKRNADLTQPLVISFEDWEVKATPQELHNLEAIMRKTVVSLEEGVHRVQFVPKLGPRKLALHAGACTLVEQYIQGIRKAGAIRLAAAYSEAAVSEFLFRVMGARTTGGEHSCQFGPCAEDWRPLGGADMIITVPDPGSPPGGKSGNMVMVSVGRTVSFEDEKLSSMDGMSKEEVQKVMSRKLNKLHEQEVIGMSKLAVFVCPDQETGNLVEAVYREQRAADATRWSTVSILAFVVNWRAYGNLPNAAYCHCLGSVNYHTDDLWTPSQLKPASTRSEERDAMALFYESSLFGIDT